MTDSKKSTAQAMAQAMGFKIADDDVKTEDKHEDVDSAADDKGDQQVVDKTDDEQSADTGGDGSDDKKDDSSGVQDADNVVADHDKKVIPDTDSGKTDQASDFDKMLAERSGGRFKSMADIDKALEEIPDGTFANEQIAKLNEYVKSGGNLNDYVRTQTVDYSKLNAYELIRAQRELMDSEMTSEEIELLIEDEFGVSDDASERQKKIAAAKLKEAGRKAYRELVEHQQKWKASVPDRSAGIEKWKEQLNAAADTVTEIVLPLNQTENFSFKVSDDLRSKVKSGYGELNRFFQRYVNPDGTENTAQFVKDMIILDNYESIVRAAAAHDKGVGKKEVIDAIKNPDFQGKEKRTGGDEPQSIAQQALRAFTQGNRL